MNDDHLHRDPEYPWELTFRGKEGESGVEGAVKLPRAHPVHLQMLGQGLL